MRIKEELERFKYGFLVSSIVSLAIIAIPLYVIILLGASYASLVWINYILNLFPSINLLPFTINIYHIIIFSILLAIILKPSDNKQTFDKETEEWITSNLDIHFRKLDEINEKIDKLEDINDYLININSNVEQMNHEENV